MPLSLNQNNILQLKEIMSELPPEAKAGTIALYGGQTVTFKWDDTVGHVITWKKSRK